MRHIKIGKIISSILICSMILASGLTVFAGEDTLTDHMNSATLAQNTMNPTVMVHRHGGFKAAVEELVKEGKLSREKAVEIEKFLEQRKEENKSSNASERQNTDKGCKYGLIKDLVDAKIINDGEAEAIRSKIREIKEQAFNERLVNLTKKGIITKDQADQVKIYFDKARQERKEKFKNLQDMTDAQRKAFFKEYKENNPMVKLVEDGVITKEQAEELSKALREGHKNNCKNH